MDRLGKDNILRNVRRIGTKYKLSNLSAIAKVVVDILLIANDFLNLSQCCTRFCEQSKYLRGIVRWPYADKSFIFPLVYYQTDNWVPGGIVRHLDKLRKDKRCNIASPCFPAVHSSASLSILIRLVLVLALATKLHRKTTIYTNCTSIALTVHIDRASSRNALRHPGIFAVALPALALAKLNL